MALIVPFNVVQVLNDFFIVKQIPKAYQLSITPSLDLEMLFIALILYLVAEILKYGSAFREQSLDLETP